MINNKYFGIFLTFIYIFTNELKVIEVILKLPSFKMTYLIQEEELKINSCCANAFIIVYSNYLKQGYLSGCTPHSI